MDTLLEYYDDEFKKYYVNYLYEKEFLKLLSHEQMNYFKLISKNFFEENDLKKVNYLLKIINQNNLNLSDVSMFYELVKKYNIKINGIRYVEDVVEQNIPMFKHRTTTSKIIFEDIQELKKYI